MSDDEQNKTSASNVTQFVSSTGELIAELPPDAPIRLFRSPSSSLVFGNTGKEMFRITSEGDVVLGEGVELTEAAAAFWVHVRRMAPVQCQHCGHAVNATSETRDELWIDPRTCPHRLWRQSASGDFCDRCGIMRSAVE